MVWDAHIGGMPVCLLGIESRPLPRRGFVPGRRPGIVDLRHAVPAVVAQTRPRRQRRQRQPSPGRAREPVRLRRLAGVDAPLAVGVRRGDRPRGDQLPRPDRVRGRLPLPRRCVRGVLQDPQRTAGDRRRGGLIRVGDRRRAGRGHGVRPRGGGPHAAGSPGTRGRRAGQRGDRPGRRVRHERGSAKSPRRCGRRSSAKWPRSSTGSTPCSGHWRWGRSTASSLPRRCGHTLSTPSSRGMSAVMSAV